ncbi:GTP cyclohydrolase 1 [Fusarium culmorum]|uniref:GTP cyclohydrolase 1 n=1 Tax=Fusarium culmorum TaxID=5516 RepID=A0A2T4GLC2_FUSCU|nr:GTP cyclohydrolase 1 [Fusarium culmorum]
MAPSEDGVTPSHKRSQDVASISGSSSSSDDSARRRKRRERKERKRKNGETAAVAAVNGAKPNAFSQRRNSLAKASRDPRDEPIPKKRRASAVPEEGTAVVKASRSPSPVIDFDGLSRPSRGTRERREETEEQQVERLDRMRGAVRTLLECVGEDPDREGLLDTPSRYAKALLFLTKGYQVNVEDIVNNALFREGHSEMVIVKDIEVFFRNPSKLTFIPADAHRLHPQRDRYRPFQAPRIAEMFARRLQIQERLTKEVAHAIMEILKPQGVAVVMESSHLCMVMRGVEKTTTSTITSCVLGCFERKSKTRNEFLNLIGINKR